MWNATKLRTSNGFTWIGQGYVHVSVAVRVCVEHVFARSPSQAKPSHDELVLPWKLEYFFLCLIQYWSNNVQCMMEAPWWRSAFTTQYPIIYGLSTNMTEKEKAVAKKHRGAKTWECEIHGKIYQREFVWVCVWVYSCDCERAYVQVYLEKVKSECRKITLRNQNATMMASLCWMNSIVDRWMDGWCFYLM